MTETERLIENKKKFNMPQSRKVMEKKGTIACGIVETTPFVWEDKLYYFEYDREYTKDYIKGKYSIVDFETGKTISSFADEHCFGAIYVENHKAYAIGVKGNFGGNTLDLFVSEDLINWEQHTVFSNPDWVMYNTSICKGDKGYIMAVEISEPVSIAGEHPYTIVFMKSEDLINWSHLDTDKCVFTKDRYAACPVIRYCDGWYYMIYLEILALYNCMPCITRTKDFKTWDPAPLNPVMMYGDEDRIIPCPERFTAEELEKIKTSLNTNNSDVDLCEFKGKTYIFYSWGNQLGKEFLAYGEYDGSMEEFFKSFY